VSGMAACLTRAPATPRPAVRTAIDDALSGLDYEPSGHSRGPSATGEGPVTGPTWSQFLRSQAEAILACDFFSVDLLDRTQAYVLTVIGAA
jgi:hypothetical protein